MEIHNQHHEEGKCEHAPIRGSIFILITKLLITLLLFDFLYVGAYYLLTLGFELPFDLHHHISALLFVMFFLKFFIQLFLIFNVTLAWANNTFYIDGKHLIKRTGILNVKEDMYEFDSVRSLTVDQSWIGRLFHYGDVILKTSASGGYKEIVTISGIQNPQKYEQMIKECL